ncbi:HPr family phosphocarrier protein [Schnuerera sp. xch1]|uniref:HPr family phosphocarrier protein n=1 Tax=Schnuerera sp. xch1 TaxID=2874283 RepID=UPI001CC14867|nr:HPr family phosphocarrier protein [Schnuerera sp. xch1]MBZ2175658.1 HPr family phosphocarrier protein [Schnuerera sp. xch1]
MISKNVILNNEVGLHARPAAVFVQTANKFSCNVYIEFNGKKVNGKSIIGVMSLGAFDGEEITIIANGVDEKQAIEELIDLVENGLNDL